MILNPTGTTFPNWPACRFDNCLTLPSGQAFSTLRDVSRHTKVATKRISKGQYVIIDGEGSCAIIAERFRDR